jgi:signal transduction histidine kinase
VFGAINMVTAESERRYGDADLELATHVARRAALAIDNARLYEEAREATRLREQVLAVVSHDLRNPLGALQLAAQLLADRVETSGVETSARKQVQVILRSSKRMERLIADLLDVASLQAGRFAVEVGQEDVGSLVDEAVETMSARAREQSISLSGRVYGRRDVRVRADRARILQVFGNLIGNALKFCRPGDHVDVRAQPGEDVCIFSVQDDGPGIADEDLPHLFAPYWSAKRHARRGTGLGLYISRGIVEAHRGRIWVETTLGAGSTFFFSIPVAGAEPAPEQR